MKHVIVLLSAFFAMLNGLSAQNITGKIKDAENNLLAKASVSLLKAKDSALVKMNASGSDGRYKFETITPGSYLVASSSVGYTPVVSGPFEFKDTQIVVPDLVLQKAAKQMQGVTVTARKPLLEVKADRMVVNVEGTINATGNDGVELLRRSPGVTVDHNDNIQMAGKNGVEVYIDGKPSPLRGADLANYLRSIQSSSIEAIELITEPSAKFEAAGNAGIINIRLKKDKSFGTNGNVTAGFNQGVYSKVNGGFALNHRTKKVNVYGNYNYFHGHSHNTTEVYREYADSIFNQLITMKNNRNNHNFKAGIDFFLNKKSTVGLMTNGNRSLISMHSDGPMSIAYAPTGIVDRILEAKTESKIDRKNINLNANYKYADVAKGKELNIDADYGYYDLHNKQYLPNYYYEADGTTEISRSIYRMNAPTDIDIYSLKADYEKTMGKSKIGFGGKTSFVETKNIFDRFNVFNNMDQKDRDRSNRFSYRENVNALYVNYNRVIKNAITIQAGLRGEQTVSKGRSIGEKRIGQTNQFTPYDSSINRSYIDVFPSASVSFAKNPMSQFSVSYSRRIDRPRYENLNPFEFMINEYTYSKGNTELKPQYTNSFALTHTYKFKLTTKLSYSHVKDMFLQVFEPDGSKMFQMVKNLATQDVASLNISYPFMYKNFTSFNNLTNNYSHYKANFNGNAIDRSFFNLQYYVQNSLKFGKKKDWTAELTGLYLSPFVWEGVYKGKSMGFVDVGLQKTVFNGNGTIKASASDIFKTMRFNGEGSYAGASNKVVAKWESQQFKLNFTYRFGSAQVKAARQRKSGLEDEAGRTNGGSSTPGQ